MKLKTRYLGLELNHPYMPGANVIAVVAARQK